ncbi:hypothetical protein Leryth_015751 [Lithospermum erythrorhizon]|nr:hypothetical protein Leryth_015751 [Lithospermum erythrorhizon]
MGNFSLESNRFSRDLLQKFMESGSSSSRHKEFLKIEEEEEEEGEGDLELNLGLSLGGRFGVDKSKLVRSSSIAACLPIVRDDDDVVAPPTSINHTLVRTSSLPVETEEEWRKRKGMQSLRRMEAKRRRSEKQRNLRAEREGDNGGQDFFLQSRTYEFSCGLIICVHDTGTSSGSDLSPASIQSLQEGTYQDASSSGLRTRANTSRPSRADSGNIPRGIDTKKRVKETRANGMEDMPCVFTKGDGPNGRRVDGILYKYGKGEEVRIMCVCHGSFLSPADFVKHAGASDVAHPLKHIVINPNPPSFC